MTGIVEIVHPAPVAYIPRRGRLRRLALIQARTPVELVRVAPDAVGPRIPVRDGRTTLGFHVIEGRLFLRVDEAVPGRDTASLLEDLANGSGGERRTLLDKAVARTPLSAQLDASDQNGKATPNRNRDHRGVPAESLGHHSLERDDTEKARVALRDWLDANVRLAGDGLYVDTGGPLLRPVRLGASAEFDTVAFPRLPAGRGQCVRGPFTPAEARDYRRRAMDAYHAAPTTEHYEIHADELPPEAEVGRDTDTLFANVAPGLVLDALAPVLRNLSGGAANEFDGVPLRYVALLGTMGLNGPGSVAGIVQRVDRVARGGIGIPSVGRVSGEALNLVRHHGSDWISPRLQERADRIVAEDAADLEALIF